MSAPRIPTLKTWRQLEQLAASISLKLFRTAGGVAIENLRRIYPLVHITVDLESDVEIDKVTRAALEGALEEMGRLER